MSGKLYIVATPIGNLADISERALLVLRTVSLIAVEDTRHSARLLQAHGIDTPMLACHDFNERQRAEQLIRRIEAGEDVALISDAGTPLISDPGYQLVRLAHRHGVGVVPVPGPSAVIAALSVAGLPSDRFTFEGFLPAKAHAREQLLKSLARETRTMIFYEAPHRILDSLQALVDCFGAEREVTLARELTKNFETVIHGGLGELLDKVREDGNQRKGEFVLVVAGYRRQEDEPDDEALRMLGILMSELPLKQAAALAARIAGLKKGSLYEAGLQLQGRKKPDGSD